MRDYDTSFGQPYPVPETKTEMKRKAQEMLMHGMANVLGYWLENEPFLPQALTEAERAEFGQVLQREADRAAKLFGYAESWSN